MSRRRPAPPHITHGARSKRTLDPVILHHKRRFLRNAQLRADQLNAGGRAYLDAWARAAAKVTLMDDWVRDHGWVDESGDPRGLAKVYFAALNTARLTMRELLIEVRESRRSAGAKPVDLTQYRGREVGS